MSRRATKTFILISHARMMGQEYREVLERIDNGEAGARAIAEERLEMAAARRQVKSRVTPR